jgi:hypothetical protein
MKPVDRFIIAGVLEGSDTSYRYFKLNAATRLVSGVFNNFSFAETKQFKSLDMAKKFLNKLDTRKFLFSAVKNDFGGLVIQKIRFTEFSRVSLNNPPEEFITARDDHGKFIVHIADGQSSYVLTNTEKSSAASHFDFTDKNSFFGTYAKLYTGTAPAVASAIKNVIYNNYIEPNSRPRDVVITRVDVTQEYIKQIAISVY